MKTLRWIANLFATTNARRAPARPKVRPSLECLEDRVVPASYVWTDASGDGLWTTAANWSQIVVPYANGVPGGDDIAIFENEYIGEGDDAFLGSNANCLIPGGNVIIVSQVQMQDSYTGTLSLGNPIIPDSFPSGGGATLIATGAFRQHGVLDLGAGSVADTSGAFYVYGQVNGTDNGSPLWLPTPFGPIPGGGVGSVLEGDGGIYIESSTAAASINAYGSDVFGIPPLSMTLIGDVDMGGYYAAGFTGSVINVEPATVPAFGPTMPAAQLTIIGDVTTDVTSVINLYPGATLNLVQLTPADLVSLKGNMNLYAGSVVNNAGQQNLELDGGYLNVLGNSAVTGNVLNDNGGTIQFADTFNPAVPPVAVLAIGGNYTQITDPGLYGATYGTLNIGIQGAASDLVTVAGNTVLGGNLNVVVAGAAPLPAPGAGAWVIFTAALGADGNFGTAPSTINLPAAGWAEAVVPGPPDVVMIYN